MIVRRKHNPLWVDQALRDNWSKLEALVGPKWMPIPRTDPRVAGAQAGDLFQEYGSGAFGTVFPTHDLNVAFKITSDSSEANLIAFTIDVAKHDRTKMPDGLVHYHRIVQLPGVRKGHLFGGPIFAIWREAAVVIGTQALQATNKHGVAYLKRFELAADSLREDVATGDVIHKEDVIGLTEEDKTREVLEYVRGSRRLSYWRGYEGDQVAFQAMPVLADLLAKTYGTEEIGRTYRFYFDHGVFLSDVHEQNVGLVPRRKPTLVVIDPGMAVFFKQLSYARPQAVANRGRVSRRYSRTRSVRATRTASSR